MTKNYAVSKNGFTVTDSETGHVLEVALKEETYHGMVMMPDQGETLPLAPWKKGENPFKDDRCFEGMQTSFSERGTWWFAISPSIPFSQIMNEVESLNKMQSFFTKLIRRDGPRLQDIVPRRTQSGYVFWDINDDLGKACDEIMKSSKSVQMAYGYARRAAMACLYMQGVAPRDAYDHVQAFFKSLQLQTGHTVKFQKQAFLDAIQFMKTYNHLITNFFVKKVTSLTQEHEPEAGRTSDADFFKAVLELAYTDQADGIRSRTT